MRIISTMVLVASCQLILGCGSGASKNLAVDDSEDPPSIFCELNTGTTLRFSDAEYAAGTGWLDSYSVQVGADSGNPVLVKVKVKSPGQDGKRPTYVAEANGAALPSLKELSGKKLIGFTVKEAGGVVLPHSGTVKLDIKTEFSYTPDGRRQLAKQMFAHEGKSFEITYDDYIWRNDGRLSGYSIRVVKAQ